MKRAFGVAMLLAAALSGARAQESNKAVAVDVGGSGTPTSDCVWVCQRGDDMVNIFTTANPNVKIATLTAANYGFSQPWDIVHLPTRSLVFVTNAGNGTVTVINNETFALVGTVDLAALFNGRNLGGMSVSASQDAVFVAGADLAGAAIFRINVPSLAATRIGGRGGPPADDCAAVRAGASGGSGNGTRKVYFTQRAANEISEINLAAGGAVSTVTLGVGVSLPDNMDRTADHRFVFVGCTKVAPSGNLEARIVRIDPLVEPLSAAVTQRFIMNAIQDLGHRAVDVTWGTGPGGVNRGFVLLSLDSGTPGVVEIDETGARVGVGVPPSGGTGGVTPSTLRFMSSIEQIFVGEVPGTSNLYNVFNAKFASPVALLGTMNSGNSEPGHFALVPTPQIVITDMCPRGQVAGTNIVTVYGAGFMPGATYTRGGAQVGFINSNMVTVDLSGATDQTIGVSIVNPNNMSAQFDTFFRRYTPEVLGAFPVDIPSASRGGYEMRSVPQYLSLTAFKAALAAEFGPYNPVFYRVFFFRNGRYVELNTLKDDGCDIAGESFWIIARDGGTVNFAGPDVRANSSGFSRIIPLNPGFNMISVPMVGGTPTTGQISWANILVTDDQTNFGTALSTTVQTAIIAPAALEFVNGAYVTADPLVVGRGYWVENIGSKPAYLLFATTAINKPSAAPSAPAGAPPPAGMNPPPPPSAGIGESSGGVCGFTGLEGLLLVLAVRGFPRRRRHRRLVA